MGRDVGAIWAVGTFASSGLLLWGIAALIPLLIHLWSRRKQQEVSWAAMEFLLAALHKQSRRMRLEQWCLLALRTLILGLLALGLARPLWNWAKATSIQEMRRPRVHTTLVLDGSYSMQFREGSETLFESAQRLARNLLSESQQGDGFSLIVMSDPPEVIIRDVSYQPAVVREQMDALQPRATGADLQATFTLIAELLAAGQRQDGRFDRHDVCLFSDLGRTTWHAATSRTLVETIGQFPANTRLFLFPVGPDSRANAAITQLQLSEPLTAVGRTVELTTTVANGGSEPLRRTLELTVDGRLLERRELNLAAETSVEVRVPYLVESPGQHRIKASIEADALAIDDQRQAILVVADALRVLCVAGRPGAADFIAWALAPDAQARLHIVPEVVTEAALLERDLQTYGAIFLCNVPQLSSVETQALRRYVMAGGGLITILGDQVSLRGDDGASATDGEDVSLWPAQLGRAVSGETYHFVPRYEQPIAASFRGFEQAGLVTVPIWYYIQLKPEEGAIEHLALDSGDPALVSCRVGAGRSLLLATAAAPDVAEQVDDQVIPWNAFISWPSFPPLVHEMLWFAVGGRGSARNRIVGDALLWDPLDPAAVPSELVAPDQTRQQISGPLTVGETVWPSARQLGIYRLLTTDSEQNELLYCVSLATQESDLKRIEPNQLPDFFASSDKRNNLAASQRPSSTEADLFRWIMAVVFILMISESSLACWLGRRS